MRFIIGKIALHSVEYLVEVDRGFKDGTLDKKYGELNRRNFVKYLTISIVSLLLYGFFFYYAVIFCDFSSGIDWLYSIIYALTLFILPNLYSNSYVLAL